VSAKSGEVQEPFKGYIDKKDTRGLWRLYIRLWTEVRQVERLSPSFLLLKRYWVMAATYDGLAVALLLWSLLLTCWAFGWVGSQRLPLGIVIPVVPITLLLARGCLAEADRYSENQAEELVASIAAERCRAATGKDRTPVGERAGPALEISSDLSSRSKEKGPEAV
jgi:hypothetical protein